MAEKKGLKGPESLLKKLERYWRKFWHFFWEEDSLLSWVVNILVAFLLIKGVIYPGLGMILQTSHPVVAVISTSMEHDGRFDQWWQRQGDWYNSQGITKEEFLQYDFRNGFNRADIMILKGAASGSVKTGEVIVYNSYIRKEPIIHRVMDVENKNGYYYYTTKGDKNTASYPFEQGILQKDVIGKAVFRIPCLGWIKIGFVCMIDGVAGKQNFISCMGG